MIIDPSTKLTHNMLLMFLPFDCGYTCDEKGEPCMESLKLTLVLQAVMAVIDPISIKEININ